MFWNEVVYHFNTISEQSDSSNISAISLADINIKIVRRGFKVALTLNVNGRRDNDKHAVSS